MNEADYCNKINEAINGHFREENHGCDSDVFVDERIEEDVIALNWHLYVDWITIGQVSRIAAFIFDAFPEVNIIMSPIKDFERVSKPH